MSLDFGNLNLRVDGWTFDVPNWFSGIANFAYDICYARDPNQSISEHFVLTLPTLTGGLSSLALGALAAEMDRIKGDVNLVEIQPDQVEVGMRVSLNAGVGGLQTITGQVNAIILDDKTPKIQIGTRWIAVKFIKTIEIIPSSFGNPQVFERKSELSQTLSSSILSNLANSFIPIRRALLDVRCTSAIVEDEFEWSLIARDGSDQATIGELIRPITPRQESTGWTLVLNTTESEELAWENLKNQLNKSELDSDVSILCSSNAILAQLENNNSGLCFYVLGRDERQLTAVEMAIKQRFEYSQPLTRSIDLLALGSGIELITFEVPSNG